LDESDEDTLAVESECCQLKEEVLKNNLSNKNIDYCLGKNSLSQVTEYMQQDRGMELWESLCKDKRCAGSQS
jgi:hypothetical protein